MELWIRSQDRTRLTKIDDLYLVHDDNNFCDYIGNTRVGHLAKYTKQGRALEVLDEIEERISLLNTMCLVHDNNSLISFKKAIGADKIKGLSYPYQMPIE